MYSPPFYRSQEMDLIYKLIKENPLALILGPSLEDVSHIPLMLDKRNNVDILMGHMARANPHWRKLVNSDSSATRFKIVFQGPNGYVSPAWYQPRTDNVPTWNYAVVHVTGRFQIVSDPGSVWDAMELIVTQMERNNSTHWKLPKSAKAIEELMMGIVVFEIVDTVFEVKFKLSQKLDVMDRNEVISQLEKSQQATSKLLAEWMKLVGPKT